MSITEYAFIAFFIAVVLVGVVDAIRNPLLVKRYYRNNGFTDYGKKQLEDVSGSLLTDGMYTDSLYTSTVADSKGAEQNTPVSQCKAWSVKRRQFTLSKATRNRNREAWSVTIVKTSTPELKFLALPTIVPEAVTYIGDGRSIEFPGDDQLESRYHVTTEHADQIRDVFSGEVRDFLLEAEILFIHQTEDELVLRRKWSAHKATDRLQREYDIAVKLHKQLVSKQLG